ncbi:GNAT family N-acetyltransferase [Myxococcota bacterium]|nr:GNAT family N-acetyltransferase [Myxococcota bacterium]MBU1535146.1 GNAT family N-acetyltransferase [Myxococcota bacterium]
MNASTDPVRAASPADLPQIVEIYNQAIRSFQSTAHMTPLTVAQRRDWFDSHTPRTYPLWVFAQGDQVLGWCSLSPYRAGREALRFTAEISYYVHEDARRRGVATALIAHALGAAPNLGLKTVFAILVDINRPSIAILEKFHFTTWGHLPAVADFHGQEYGQLYLGLRVA